MKILTKWSVPTKAPVNYVRKTAMAAVMLAASTVGMTSCDSFTKTKIDDISYKVHEAHIEEIQQSPYNTISYQSLAQEYKKMGLYAGAVYNQCMLDKEIVSQIINDLGNKTGRSYAAKDARSRAMMDISLIADILKDNKDYHSWKNCDKFLNNEAKNTSSHINYEEFERLSKNSYKDAMKKALKDDNDFRVAELLAFKTYRLNYLILEASLKNAGFSSEDINRSLVQFMEAHPDN